MNIQSLFRLHGTSSGWQTEFKHRTTTFIVTHRQCAAVFFGNTFANVQSQADALFSSRKKRLKDFLNYFRADPWPCV